MAVNSNGNLREALTFDDVLIRPGLSGVMPSDADLRTRLTREIVLNIPIIASAMDTVTTYWIGEGQVMGCTAEF